jgi:hypothetical protein
MIFLRLVRYGARRAGRSAPGAGELVIFLRLARDPAWSAGRSRLA